MWSWIGGTAALVGASMYFGLSQYYFPEQVRIVHYPNDEMSVKNETDFPILVTRMQYYAYNVPKRVDAVLHPQKWTVPRTETFTHTHNAGEFRNDIVKIGVTFRMPYVPIPFTVWRWMN